MTRILSIDELAKMQSQVVNATESDEPVAIQTPTESVVNGNPLNTGSVTPKDYVLRLYLPKHLYSMSLGAKESKDGKCFIQDLKVKEKFINSHISRVSRSYASKVAIAFTDFKEDGTSELFSADDLLKVYETFNEEVINACEKLVSTVLDVPENLVNYVSDVSLMENCSLIIKNNPSFFQDDTLSD